MSQLSRKDSIEIRCRALRLTERAPLLACATLDPDENDESARHRFETWRRQTPFQEEEWFRQRLSMDGLTREEFLQVLGLAACSTEEGGPRSDWQRRFEEAYAVESVEGPEPALYGLSQGAFTPIIAPLVRGAGERVRQSARSLRNLYPAAPFDPERVVSLLWEGTAKRLDWMLGRALVLELHLARLQGRLRGESSRERFADFVRQMSSPPCALGFFQEYPVLARAVLEALDLWEEAGVELLGRLCQDWKELRSHFHLGGDPGLLQSLTGGGGDLHGGGRAVRVLTFESGFRLSYKPRPVDVYVRFGELLDWLNERGAPGLASARVLACDGYGWMEFVAARPCASRAELERFYRRQGAFLALFYVLNASDLHRENLIASGEHPLFIDLECVLTPDYGQLDTSSHVSLAHYEMNNSVMRLMLLPFFHDNRRQEVIDPSGLGGDEGQLSFHEIPVWDGFGTDEMRLKRVQPAVAAAQHRPSLDGRVASPLDFRQELEEGFSSLYRLLSRHLGELLAVDSPLSGFDDVDVRIVFRPSQLYAYILTESVHPNLLRDAVDRDRHFDRLWYGIDRSKMADISLRLLPVEREDLWRGDIPCFSARGDSLDVRGSMGTVLPGLLARSGVEMVMARLRGLGEEDLRQQLWYIRSSLTALAIELQSMPPCFEPVRVVPAGTGESLLAISEAVSRRLHESALRWEGRAAWLGLAKTRSRGWWLRPLDADLYGGLPGVALYLAHAGEILQRPEDSLLARQSLAELDRQLERRDRVPFVGGFDGWGGLLYTWLRLGLLWKDEEFMQKALRAVPKMAGLIDGDRDLDLIRGAAGGIVPLLSLHRLSGDEDALELARRMGDRLVSAASPFREGLCWRTASFPVHPLTGFSHGTSGFAWALLELFGATGEPRYRETAVRALTFEREFFSEIEKNWMDLRPVLKEIGTADYPREAVYSISWCHGAAGIGLSRLRMMRHLDAPELLQDVRIAAETTLRLGFGVNHCLCHGDLGNLELLVQAGSVLGEPSWRDLCAEKTRQVLAGIEQRGFLCGVPFYVETPGLMEGLAGIGYGLLRQAEPNRVPCSLLLDVQ